MKYLSVCSGIEAATVAWHPLGWRPIAFAEVDKFPCAVLAHHYPTVPNWGDMTKFHEWPNAAIDVLVGGTPCQSFSVAGLRKGLDDPRGNLMLTYLAIARQYRPTWLVWENVPGVLSSNRGRDFGTFLGALGQLGYGFAYRILDAQYCGVPQRRRRVFVVGHSGDWRRAAAVLFERHSLSGHPAPGRETGQDTAGSTGDGIARCLMTGEAKRQDWESCNFVTHTLRADGFDASEDGTGRGTPLVPIAIQSGAIKENPAIGPDGVGIRSDGIAYTLEARAEVQAVAFALRGREVGAVPEIHGDGDSIGSLRASSGGSSRDYLAFDCKASGRNGFGVDTTAPTLRAMGHAGSHQNAGGQVAVSGAHGVRRLTPMECERLQGFPDGYSAIPWRNKPADQCPDGPRYKAIGNSMAVPVMRWIGERIDLVDSIKDLSEAAA